MSDSHDPLLPRIEKLVRYAYFFVATYLGVVISVRNCPPSYQVLIGYTVQPDLYLESLL